MHCISTGRVLGRCSTVHQVSTGQTVGYCSTSTIGQYGTERRARVGVSRSGTSFVEINLEKERTKM
eukprot:3252227-Rhodomonas_salina.1